MCLAVVLGSCWGDISILGAACLEDPAKTLAQGTRVFPTAWVPGTVHLIYRQGHRSLGVPMLRAVRTPAFPDLLFLGGGLINTEEGRPQG